MTRESVVSWWRANSALGAFLAAQLVGAIVWGATLQSRVGVIEARGPPLYYFYALNGRYDLSWIN